MLQLILGFLHADVKIQYSLDSSVQFCFFFFFVSEGVRVVVEPGFERSFA